jgi:hypothetical protein
VSSPRGRTVWLGFSYKTLSGDTAPSDAMHLSRWSKPIGLPRFTKCSVLERI